MPHDHSHRPGHDHAGHGHSHHGHSHHGHSHHGHGPAGFGAAFAAGVALNVALVATQLGAGIWAHSTALIADSVHNLGDALALVIAWVAAKLGERQPSARRTYGWGRGSILAALVNATVLLVSTGGIAVEAVRRLFQPEPVAGGIVMVVAAAAIVVNGAVAMMFMRGRHDDLNIRGAFLHMAGDAGVSAGVVVAAWLITLTGWVWLDPVASLVIGAVIVAGTWGLLRESAGMAMDAVPRGIDPASVLARLEALPGVLEVHDLHIWSLSTTKTAATAHLVAPGAPPVLLPQACTLLREEFGIAHCTFQVETSEVAEACTLRPAAVI